MPLYRFDILRNGIEEPDTQGTEFQDDEDAIRGAARGLAEMLMDEPGSECRFSCVIRRETSHVAIVTLTVATRRPAIGL
jgi:hypothetical protein